MGRKPKNKEEKVELKEESKEEVVEEKKTEENMDSKKDIVDFEDFDKINLKVQKAINDMLTKDNLPTVEFLDSENMDVRYIDSGFVALNYIMSGKLDGGYPASKITELQGENSTGKTLLSTILAVKSLLEGRMVYWFDSEAAFSFDFAKLIAKTMGVVDYEGIVKKINYMPIDTIDDLTQTVLKIVGVFEKNKIETGATIIVDSIAFLATQKETMDLKAGEVKGDMGTKAKLLRQFFRVLKNQIKHLDICMVLTNQLISQIGQIYSDPKVGTSGSAIPYAASVRIRLLTAKKIVDENNKEKVVGLILKAKTIKSRLTVPYKIASFPIFWNGRFSRWSGLIDVLLSQDIFKKKNNTTLIFEDIEFMKKDFLDKICKNKDVWERLKNAVKNQFYKEQETIAKDDEEDIEVDENQTSQVDNE